MRTIVVISVLALCTSGAFSSLLNDSQRDKLLQLRNVCLQQSGISQIDVILAKRAVGPAKKLIQASHCVVQGLIEHQNDDEVREVIERVKESIRNSELRKVLDRAVQACVNLLGIELCVKLGNLIDLTIKNVKNA